MLASRLDRGEVMGTNSQIRQGDPPTQTNRRQEGEGDSCFIEVPEFYLSWVIVGKINGCKICVIEFLNNSGNPQGISRNSQISHDFLDYLASAIR